MQDYHTFILKRGATKSSLNTNVSSSSTSLPFGCCTHSQQQSLLQYPNRSLSYNSNLVHLLPGLLLSHPLIAYRVTNLSSSFSNYVTNSNLHPGTVCTLFNTRTLPHASDWRVLRSSLSSIAEVSLISWNVRDWASLKSISTTVCTPKPTPRMSTLC